MNGIFYFSSTGNSLLAAKRIKEKIGGELIYIPDYKGDCSEFEKLVVVTPVYAFSPAAPAFDFLSSLKSRAPLYVVLTYGGKTFGAEKVTARLCAEKGLNLKAVHGIRMPVNFTVVAPIPQRFINSALKSAPKRIEKVVNDIALEKECLPKIKPSGEEVKLKTRESFNKMGKGLSAGEECVLCGKCVSSCPAGNITVQDGKIQFGDKCLMCLGCYHRCPQKAIKYNNKNYKLRYFNPEIDESEIGKSE